MTTTPKPGSIMDLEDEYNALTAIAKTNPARWGAEQEDRADRIRHRLLAEYDFHGTDDWDRIV